MRYRRLEYLFLAVALGVTLGAGSALAGPLAVIANYTDPGTRTRPPGGWPSGTVTVIDTATDAEVIRLKVGANPAAVAITPDGTKAVVACSQSSEIYFIDLTAKPPKLTGKLIVGSGEGDTFYPAALAITPDGKDVIVNSTIGGEQNAHNRSTRVKEILVVSIEDQSVVQTESLPQDEYELFAQASAISSKGTLVVISPGSNPSLIYGLPYAAGQVVLPDAPEEDRGTYPGPAGYNVSITPDGATAIVPLWTQGVMLFGIDDGGKLKRDEQLVASGGQGTHSVAISADGKLAYVRNLAPPGNISIFEIGPGPALKDTGRRLNASGIPELLWLLYPLFKTTGTWVGSQMVAVTPDGKKVYSASSFGDAAASEFNIGDGVVEVFNADKSAPISRLVTGKNPIAIAIQPK